MSVKRNRSEEFDILEKFCRDNSFSKQKSRISETFLDWAKANKCVAEKLQFGTSEITGGSMFAKEEINSGDRIVEIPLDLVISEELAKKEISKDDFAGEFEDGRIFVFAFMILQMFDSSSKFFPYLLHCTSSTDFERFPLYWSSQELNWIKGTALINTIKQKKEELSEMHAEFHKFWKNESKRSMFSLENFLWAYSIFYSRAFPGKLINSSGLGILLPFADLLNHKYKTPIEWKFEDNRVSFVALDGFHVAPSEQVFNNYGAKANGEWLIGYGFTEQNNAHDVVPLLPKSNQDQVIEKAREILIFIKEDHLLKSEENGLLPEDLITKMKTLIHASFPNFESDSVFLQFEICKHLSCMYWKKICDTFSNSKERLDFLIKDDKFVISQSNTLVNERNAKIYRLGQVLILKKANEYLHVYLKSLISNQPYSSTSQGDFLSEVKVSSDFFEDAENLVCTKPLDFPANSKASILQIPITNLVSLQKVRSEYPVLFNFFTNSSVEFEFEIQVDEILLILFLVFRCGLEENAWIMDMFVEIDEDEFEMFSELHQQIIESMQSEDSLLPFANALQELDASSFVHISSVFMSRMQIFPNHENNQQMIFFVPVSRFPRRAQESETPNAYFNWNRDTHILELLLCKDHFENGEEILIS